MKDRNQYGLLMPQTRPRSVPSTGTRRPVLKALIGVAVIVALAVIVSVLLGA